MQRLIIIPQASTSLTLPPTTLPMYGPGTVQSVEVIDFHWHNSFIPGFLQNFDMFNNVKSLILGDAEQSGQTLDFSTSP